MQPVCTIERSISTAITVIKVPLISNREWRCFSGAIGRVAALATRVSETTGVRTTRRIENHIVVVVGKMAPSARHLVGTRDALPTPSDDWRRGYRRSNSSRRLSAGPHILKTRA